MTVGVVPRFSHRGAAVSRLLFKNKSDISAFLIFFWGVLQEKALKDGGVTR